MATLTWKPWVDASKLVHFFFFYWRCCVSCLSTGWNQHDRWCHLDVRKPPLWEEGWALSSRRDRRQHAVWETAWKSASVNTPRPHVLPGQRGWPLSRHICTQSLSFFASQPRRQSGGKGGREEFPGRERTCLLCDASVNDESHDI